MSHTITQSLAATAFPIGQHLDLESAILNRHSTRAFVPTPVPSSTVLSALEIAQHSPSNSNIQPWRMYLVSGDARNRLAHALIDVASKETPNIPALPESFKHFRSELGLQVYGLGMGIPREDVVARTAAVLRNYDFFGAPVVGIVCMHRELGSPDAISVGMWLQTLLLALTERGLDSCVEVSVAGYPDVIKRELSIPDDLNVLCGVAIGYEDKKFKANSLRIAREPVEKNVVFVGI